MSQILEKKKKSKILLKIALIYCILILRKGNFFFSLSFFNAMFLGLIINLQGLVFFCLFITFLDYGLLCILSIFEEVNPFLKKLRLCLRVKRNSMATIYYALPLMHEFVQKEIWKLKQEKKKKKLLEKCLKFFF